VRILLQAGAQRNARCHKPLPNFTPLELAALGGWPDVVKLLATGGPEYRALQLAVYKPVDLGPAGDRSERSPDRPAVVRYLVEKLKTPVAAPKEYRNFTYTDPTYNYRLDFEGAPLEVAAKNGRVVALALMLKSKPPDLDLSGPYGHWLLAKAATSGHLEVVRLLVEAGAPVNDPLSPELPSPALAEAVRSGHRHVVRYLLEKGAKTSPDQVPERGRSYEWQGYRFALELRPPLVEAAARGDLATVRLLVKHGAWLGRYITSAPLNWMYRIKWAEELESEYYQVTPLEAAVHDGRLQVARYLVEKGAVPTPDLLNVAARQGYPEMVRFLLGLRPGREERKRALAWAADAEIAQLLLGADPRGKADIAGNEVPTDALYQAITFRRHELLRTLLEAGADPNTRYKWVVSPDIEPPSLLLSAILDKNAVATRLLAIYGATFKDEAEQKRAIEVADYTWEPYLAMIVANLTGRQDLVCPAIERYDKYRLDAGEGLPMEFQVTSCP
ncbi:ankyrin repeat domain-containing protein, partial [Oceanithermus desulfurans]